MARYPLLPIDAATASCFARIADEQLWAGRRPRRHDSKVIFTLADGEVEEISAGRRPEIDLVEGCS